MMWIQILQERVSRSFLVQGYMALRFWFMVIQFVIFMENEICEIEKLIIPVYKINLRSVSHITLYRFPALRAKSKFSAEPRVWPIMGNIFAWCCCIGFWVINFQFEYINERLLAYDWFNMACRNGPTLKLIPFQAILFYGRRQFAQIMASKYHYFFVVLFCLCSNVCCSFSFFFCPAGVVMMWIQILQRRVPSSFIVQSYEVLKCWSMAIKYWIFNKK